MKLIGVVSLNPLLKYSSEHYRPIKRNEIVVYYDSEWNENERQNIETNLNVKLIKKTRRYYRFKILDPTKYIIIYSFFINNNNIRLVEPKGYWLDTQR